MRTAPICLLLAALSGAGCVSKKNEQLAARQAYIAGQQQAMQAAARIQQQQGPVVFVQGPVRNPMVRWEEGMMLSQAIVAADYTGFMNPGIIRVLRDGKVAGQLKGIDLLHHQDLGLEAGDTVILMP
jgi:hypothetical protein